MFSKLFLVVAAISATALSQIPAPTCYTSGTGVSDCSQFIASFCASINGTDFLPGEKASRCYSVDDKRCDIIAFRSPTDPTGHIIEANCNAALNNIAQNCPFGGFGKFTNAPLFFTYTLDPNADACTSQVQGAS